MLRSHGFLNNSKGSLPKRLGLLILCLLIIKPCQQMEVLTNERVLGIQHSCTDCQCLVQQQISLLMFSLLYVEFCHVERGEQRVKIFGAEHLLTNAESPLKERLGLFILALV